MKTRSLMKKGIKATFLFALALAVTNCSKDDDTPPEYDFEQDFEEVGEMPEVTIEEPAVVEPDLGGVEQSAETENMMADLQDGGDKTAETEAKIEAVNDFAATLSDDVKQEAASLTADRVAEILAIENFDGNLAEAQQALENAPEEVKALMPKINFSADFNLAQIDNSKTGANSEKTYTSTKQSEGSCIDKAQAAFDNAMAGPIQKKAEQEGEVAEFETNALGNVETREQTRKNNLSEGKTSYSEEVVQVVTDMLAFADSIEDNDADLAATVRNLAYLYTVDASAAITTWYNAAVQVVENKKAAEEQDVEAVVSQTLAQIQANFDAILENAQTILDDALAKCHDQGRS